MECLTLTLPAMFADHHVIEVRRVLSELPGVGAIYASSAFLSAEIEYDPAITSPEAIEYALKAAGYLDELPFSVEVGILPAGEDGDQPFFRHSTAYTQAGKTVSFAQNIPISGRALWPCPGMSPAEHSVLKREEAEHA